MQASDLAAMDMNGTSDPYVKERFIILDALWRYNDVESH